MSCSVLWLKTLSLWFLYTHTHTHTKACYRTMSVVRLVHLLFRLGMCMRHTFSGSAMRIFSILFSIYVSRIWDFRTNNCNAHILSANAQWRWSCSETPGLCIIYNRRRAYASRNLFSAFCSSCYSRLEEAGFSPFCLVFVCRILKRGKVQWQ